MNTHAAQSHPYEGLQKTRPADHKIHKATIKISLSMMDMSPITKKNVIR
jgi:hypothetical protein